MIDRFLHQMFDNNSQATKFLFFQILGIVSVYILTCGCSEEPPFDPQIPMEIACADCGKYVSQRDEECDNCDFLVSNSIAVFKENEKAKKEELKMEERLRIEQNRKEEKLRIEQNRKEERLRIVQNEWDRLDGFPLDFNARFVPGSDSQKVFFEIFESYLLQQFAKNSHEFDSQELSEKRNDFTKRIKQDDSTVYVKVKNSEIPCGCAGGKVLLEESGLQRSIVTCPRCLGNGFVVGTIKYRVFYSSFKPGGIQERK